MTKPIIKQSPADFYVEERLHFPLEGSGEHLWLLIEKSGMNTVYLKRQIARLSGCPQKDIGHSGLKDRRAITRQWLSLPLKYAASLPEKQKFEGEYWRIIDKQVHSRKLRIGSHRENFFRIIIRRIAAERRMAIEEQLATIQAQGFPNYFGEQRFGSNNLAQAQQWVARGVLPKKPEERSRVLSTLRAALFNAQLAARVADHSWHRLIAGDRAMLSGSHSHFAVEQLDEDLIARTASGDLSPAGYLPGKSEIVLQAQAAAIAAQALADWEKENRYLCQYMQGDWRALRVLPQQLQWQWQDAQTLTLSFLLPSGAFATALIAHLLPDYQEAEDTSHD